MNCRRFKRLQNFYRGIFYKFGSRNIGISQAEVKNIFLADFCRTFSSKFKNCADSRFFCSKFIHFFRNHFITSSKNKLTDSLTTFSGYADNERIVRLIFLRNGTLRQNYSIAQNNFRTHDRMKSKKTFFAGLGSARN